MYHTNNQCVCDQQAVLWDICDIWPKYVQNIALYEIHSYCTQYIGELSMIARLLYWVLDRQTPRSITITALRD